MKTILFYNDAPIVGGHEIMAIEAAKVLSEKYHIIFMFSIFNTDLQNRLKKIDKIEAVAIRYYSNKFQVIRNFLSFKTRHTIYIILKKYIPDLCILAQGNIEISFILAYSAKKLKIPCVSYIPLTQPFVRTSRNKLLGLGKDYIHQFFYSFPDAFITISEPLKQYIHKVVPQKPIFIVHNKILNRKFKRMAKDIARQSLGLPHGKYIIGYIGRIEKWHKGLDMFIDYLSKYANEFPSVVFLFVGKGPYQDKLDRIKEKKSNIIHIQWTSDLSAIYSSIDCLVLPSRYEGVSLSMMEGMYYKLPIIASNIPEFSEFIPRDNLFEFGNYDDLTDCIKRALSNSLKLTNMSKYILSPDQFETDFIGVVKTIFNQ